MQEHRARIGDAMALVRLADRMLATRACADRPGSLLLNICPQPADTIVCNL